MITFNKLSYSHNFLEIIYNKYFLFILKLKIDITRLYMDVTIIELILMYLLK